MTSSQTPKPPTKPSKPQPSTTTPPSRSSSLSAHLAMVELKQRILTSISKLSDRDTHQIAVEDLEKIAQTLTPDGIPMFLNCLYESLNDPKAAVKKESLRLLAFLCSVHGDLTNTHLTKIVSHIVKRLKDADTAVKDACREAIGSLSAQYLRGSGGEHHNGGAGGSVVGLFAKPLFEAMSEQNKGVQAGAALCMARMMECATDPPVPAFQKLCPRVCKLLHSQNFLMKSALLLVVARLSQVGALAPQSLESLLPSIHECLGSPDWATRKAAADTLTAIGQHSSHLISDGGEVTITVLESCRFDKIKPVRDSMTEALQLWKKLAGKGDGGPDEQKTSSADSEPAEDNAKITQTGERKSESAGKDFSNGSPTSDSKAKAASILDKAVGILKKKPPALSDKEINPDFFQKLETRVTDDLPVEIIVPQRLQNALNTEEEATPSDADSWRKSSRTGSVQPYDANGSANFRYRSSERDGTQFSRHRDNSDSAFDKMDTSQKDSSGWLFGSKSDGQSESSFMNNKGNWLAIQRQLLQLERQQSHLVNMLQEFMGGSHNNMATLENRVRGLERIVEDMAHDLSMSSGRGTDSYLGVYEGSSSRHGGKYSGFSDYSSCKFGKAGDGRMPYGERFAPSGRGSSWRSEAPEPWDFHSYGNSRNGHIHCRRAGASPTDVRSPKSDHGSDQVNNRRVWEKGTGPFRLGEGPSARSVWQASKDEATLEAIRVAGEDKGLVRTARVAIPELTAEAMGDENGVQERDPVWTNWTNAMDALHVGDIDTAFAEVLSTGDDQLLVKLMDRTGPVIDQLTNEVACEVLHAVGQFLLEHNLLDICLSWTQQLAELILDHGPDSIPIPVEVKRQLLLNLNEVSSTMELPEDWEGAAPELLEQLASAWEIDLQHVDK
uniref:TOG domain-containing protein n=1 Tax=Kalanchoe fedtschenkoi TaxID=63787 RepID=A0A7N0TZU4_KALFE